MGIEAVIFDLDGTLVDTSCEGRRLILNRTLADLNLRVSPELIDHFWYDGLKRDEIIEKVFGVSLESFWVSYSRHDNVELRAKFTNPYEDSAIVEELRSKGTKTGILTSAPQHIIELEVGMIGKDLFDIILRANPQNGIKYKPHPEGLLSCLQKVNVKPKNAIYVGNGPEDVLTAKNAQVQSALILRDSYRPKLTVKPDYVVTSLKEINEIANSSNS